uniref:Oligopeptide ABC transporter, periplasmic oligopeptide-binding protein OppA (TC 3.A.1.5.1) n=1 Tax=uncultured bacterium contig00040 TaxID=1181528 RepID=A0A806K0G9_9BACT|nr:oligopeptide ABC transporter, periplasmic oligopeptide-binding protein OppA (TC 3.A.1.5.1) [uncultured bacterium contig00040]
MKTKRIIAMILALVFMLAFVASCGGNDEPDTSSSPPPSSSAPPSSDSPPPSSDSPPPAASTYGRDPYSPPAATGNVPREEALYFSGLQWGEVNGWNPYSNNMNNNMAIVQDATGARITMFETPYMYNMLDNKMYPLIADGPYTWNADRTELTYKIKKAAYWSDGTKITAQDAAFTYSAGDEYNVGGVGSFQAYIDKVEAVDDETVRITAVTVGGKPANPYMLEIFLMQNYILQEAWLRKMIERNGSDSDKINADLGEDVVWSGPYTKYYADNIQVIMVRDDGYWGQHADMWGKLPGPKYLAHIIFGGNDSSSAALAVGEVDVSQNYIDDVQKLWLEQGLPISTYLPESPYSILANMPTAWFNMNSPKVGIDRAEVRRAIAMAVDYDAIYENAVTRQSVKFSDVPRSLMAPFDYEQAMFDKSKVAHLQWSGNDAAGANALLDAAGIVDTNGDGWRDIDGVNLEFNACCPNGWNDWEKAMVEVANAGEKIGIKIETYFPEWWPNYMDTFTAGHQTEMDIFMYGTQGSNPVQPWSRIRGILSSEWVGNDGNWTGNFGQYVNAEVDQLIAAIPLETDQAKIKDMYTRLVEIYLTEVPSFSLMYRPQNFHVVSELYWVGFTEAGDGRNVPPDNCINGYAIADLYNLRPAG